MTATQFWKTLVPEGATSRHYEILQEIASGGMATVYLGMRRGPVGFERVVALKRALHVPGELDAGPQLAREASLAARVHHPNVVPVIDVERVDGALLLVMDYVEGASLARLIEAGALSPRLVARILLDVCAGLDAIHGTRDDDGALLGLVHRDISPQNILVGIDGAARITDFGLATWRTSTRTTQPGTRHGKPGYMAPEYVAHGVATATTDVFALAVVTWEALTGRTLFGRASTLEDVEAHERSEVPAPSAVGAETSEAWDELSLRALGRTASPRFGTARELEDAVLRVAQHDIASRAEVTAAVEAVAHRALWLRRSIVRERLRASEPPPPAEPSGLREMPTRRSVPAAKRIVPTNRTTLKLSRRSFA